MFLILPDVFKLFTAALIMALVLVPFIITYRKSLFSLYEVFLLGNVCLLYFVLFKQGFVRADAHLNTYYSGVAFVIVMTLFFSRQDAVKEHLKKIIFVVIVFSATGYVGLRGEVIDMNIGKSLFAPHKELTAEQKKKERALPSEVLQDIGAADVDFLGYETSYIFYNNLHYNPRPIFQSYSVYHPDLVQMNVAKYESDNAPEFVLYRHGSIGERHPCWDEPRLFLTLLERYQIHDTIPSRYGNPPMILFKRTQQRRQLTEKVLLDTIITLNSSFRIPSSDKPVYMYAETEYTALGKIRRTLFQPAPLTIEMTYSDQTESTHSYLIPLMRSGVPINKRLLSPNEALLFFKEECSRAANTLSARVSGGNRWVESSIHTRFIEYTVEASTSDDTTNVDHAF
jgi:hypothetical protein